MKLETVISEGLAYNAYVVSDGGVAAIVDPSRDIDRYLDCLRQAEARLTLIFETHRNEDYVSGASELARRTGDKVWRGASPDYTVPYASRSATDRIS